MRQWIKTKRLNKAVILGCFFVFGMGLGTIAGNLMFIQVAEPAYNGIFLLLQENLAWREQAGSGEKFLYIGKTRIKEGIAGWILGMTVCADLCFFGLALYGGLFTGWTIAYYTYRLGLLGLPVFLLSWLPQIFIYFPAWQALIRWGLGPEKKIRPLSFAAVVLFLLAGAVLETWINPFFLSLAL